MSKVVNLAPGREKTLLKMRLASSMGSCRGADVVGKGDAISTDGDARAVGIALLRADLVNHFGVSDFRPALGWDVFQPDDKEGAGSLDVLACAVGGGADTLAEAAKFLGIIVVPDLVEIRVLADLPIF